MIEKDKEEIASIVEGIDGVSGFMLPSANRKIKNEIVSGHYLFLFVDVSVAETDDCKLLDENYKEIRDVSISDFRPNFGPRPFCLGFGRNKKEIMALLKKFINGKHDLYSP